jgi:hypothetical protein
MGLQGYTVGFGRWVSDDFRTIPVLECNLLAETRLDNNWLFFRCFNDLC